MDLQAEFSLSGPEGQRLVTLTGDWTTYRLAGASSRLTKALKGQASVTLNAHGIRRCDTAGALAIVKALQMTKGTLDARPETQRLVNLVDHAQNREHHPHRRNVGVLDLLVRLGHGAFSAFGEVRGTLGFIGHLVVSIGRTGQHPSRLRWAPLINLCECAGLDAIPVVLITSVFIGAVIALLGINTLQDFGAQVLVVETIGISVLREFGIVITAVLLAGRSASSFAAEIGSMKMNQEVDAMRVMGVDSFDALVLPRVVALMIMMPLLAFIADMAGLLGGLIVSWTSLDLSPTFFLERIVDNVGQKHFWIGLSKAPVMALVIAVIGCRQGLDVEGDVESLGRKVTAAVVQAIFAIILIDAVFALVFMGLDV